jgi:hypothetical protein
MMKKFPSKETVERLRLEYPKGSRIELINMDDPYSKLVPGDRGTVQAIDDTGTIFPAWDNGSGLGIVYGVDAVRKLDEPLSITEAIRKSEREAKARAAAPVRNPKRQGAVR